MSGIRTNAAAAMLGVSANTLRSWERRYGFPQPRRSAGGHRQYELSEIEALRSTLAETHNISSAIMLARERGEGPSSSRRLLAALAAFDEAKVDRLLEESLALRSLERTVEELLLAALGTLAPPDGRLTRSRDGDHPDSRDQPSPEYEFAWRQATGWLSAMKRLSPPATRPEGILIFDASGHGGLDSLHAQALELMLRRAGLRTLLLAPSIETSRLGRAVRALQPHGVVLTGRRCSLDRIGRLVYAVRAVAGDLAVFDFRGAIPDTGASTVVRLGDAPTAARERLLAMLGTGGGRLTSGARDAGPPPATDAAASARRHS